MKQRHYRVTLYPNANFIADKIALMAVKSNGEPSEKRMSLDELKGLFKYQTIDLPATGKNMVCTITGGHTLTLDENVKGHTICQLLIEEVELLVLQPEEPPYLSFSQIVDKVSDDIFNPEQDTY